MVTHIWIVRRGRPFGSTGYLCWWNRFIYDLATRQTIKIDRQLCQRNNFHARYL